MASPPQREEKEVHYVNLEISSYFRFMAFLTSREFWDTSVLRGREGCNPQGLAL